MGTSYYVALVNGIWWDRIAWLWRGHSAVGEVTAPTWSECKAELDAIASVPDPVEVFTTTQGATTYVHDHSQWCNDECPHP